MAVRQMLPGLLGDDKYSPDDKHRKGFALIFVMVFVAMIMGILGDVVYQTQITAKNTLIEEDQIYAQMAARTGVEFAKFMLVLNKLSASYENNPAIPIPKNLYNMLNGQPIGADSFKEIAGLTGVDFLSVMSPEILNALKVMKGYFVLNITSENSKFNLNLLQSSYSNTANKAISRIFSTPDTEKLLQLYGYSPEKIVDNLTSYIKISVTDASLEASVVGDYTSLGLKYLPKHGALETLEELRRIPGFEVDEIYNMFSPYFTIWPISGERNTLNINSASAELISTLMTPQGKEPEENSWDKFDDYRLKNTFAQNNIGTWFQSNLIGYNDDKDSDEIRKNIFGTKDTIFRIECRGVKNNLEKKMILIVQQNKSANSTIGNGTGTGSGSSSETEPGSETETGTGTGTGTENPLPVNGSPSQTEPFNILYSQWVD